MTTYAIVEFISGRSVDIIPMNWLCSEEEDECFWPSSQTAPINRMVKSKATPQDSWRRYRIRILGKAGTYERAREKLNLALETSDLQTDAEEETRKRRRTARYIVSDESDSSDVESPVKQSDTTESAAVQDASLAGTSGTIPFTSHSPATSSSRSSATRLHLPPLPPSTVPPTTSTISTTPSTPSSSRSSATRLHLPPSLPSTVRLTTSTINTTLSPPSSSRSSATRSHSPPSSPSTTPSLNNSTPHAPPRQVHDRAFMQKVLTLLEDVRETQRLHGGILKSILQKGRVEHDNYSLPDGVSFPLKTIAELHGTEEKLADPSFQTGLESCLSDLGGRTVQETTKRMMAFIMDNSVALQINFIGRNNKLAFGKTKLFEVVNKALKKNAATSACNRQEAEKAVSKWLSGARDRDGNRNLRRQRQQEQLQGE